MNSKILEEYARLIVKGGANVHRGQEVVLGAPVECAAFSRLVAKYCYEEGAADVILQYDDQEYTRLRLENADISVLEKIPAWKAESQNYYADRDAVYLRVASSDPDVFAGIDQKKMGAAIKAASLATKPASDSRMADKRPWTIAAAPSAKWAKKVFPELPTEDAVEKLWEAILLTVGVDGKTDPVEKWLSKMAGIEAHAKKLTDLKIKTLHYTNGIGTDFTVGLPENVFWAGGGAKTPDGAFFSPNMPTEEVFTAPHRLTANGKLVSSMPLNYSGNVIDGFSFVFKNGKVVDFAAEKGYDVLAELLATDEGAKYLGEIALVPYSSPIRQSGILFYSTLFDENASCHFAVGKAYPCVEGAGKMTQEELLKAGINTSLAHVDFMVGTKDLTITAVTTDGKTLSVFEAGEWVL